MPENFPAKKNYFQQTMCAGVRRQLLFTAATKLHEEISTSLKFFCKTNKFQIVPSKVTQSTHMSYLKQN
jgi:hypothetical protein